jgi:hypothetical protein
MVYRAKYRQKIRFDSERNRKILSDLWARFRFRRETAPKNRKGIRERIESFTAESRVRDKHGKHPAIPLRFLPKGDSLDVPDSDYYGHVFETRFASRLFLKFDISVYSFDRTMPSREMVDLEAVNNYILTGEEPNRR